MNLHMESNDAIKPHNYPYPSMNKLPKKRPADWDEPPSLLLDEDGLIQDCSKPVESLFGYRLGELAWQHISCLFPHLSEIALIQQGRVNPKLDFISRCGHIFLGLNKQGNAIPTELNFVRFEHDGSCTLKLILRPSGSTAS
jgi:hypothetical protein